MWCFINYPPLSATLHTTHTPHHTADPQNNREISFRLFSPFIMPSSLQSEDSARSLIPPTPESDITNSPRSSHTMLDSSEITHIETPINPPQKRKAGRKPVYKTAQERRDRNRKAQLDFRARRSAYIGRLEESYRSLEKVVVELQVSNRVANDALARANDALTTERSKVRYLERMLQSPSTFSAPQQGRVQTYSSTNAMSLSTESCPAQTGPMQGVSFPHHSLITLEQQISPTPPTMNQLFSAENFLGMLPLPLLKTFEVLVFSCRCVPGVRSSYHASRVCTLSTTR